MPHFVDGSWGVSSKFNLRQFYEKELNTVNTNSTLDSSFFTKAKELAINASTVDIVADPMQVDSNTLVQSARILGLDKVTTAQ